tara:strand:+ start:721 stop:828 length:108 start_codon:yes stop_codon:yes gene_type:complete
MVYVQSSLLPADVPLVPIVVTNVSGPLALSMVVFA